MRFEPLHRCEFAPTESRRVTVDGEAGSEGQGFLLVEGRSQDGALTPDSRRAMETDDGAVLVFAWHGYGRSAEGSRQLLGGITHLSDDSRYRLSKSAMCVLTGAVRTLDGSRLDVSELIWEPLSEGDG